MLCFLDNLPSFTLFLWVLSLQMLCAPPNSTAMVGSHFDSFKHLCSIAQSVSFLWQPIFCLVTILQF